MMPGAGRRQLWVQPPFVVRAASSRLETVPLPVRIELSRLVYEGESFRNMAAPDTAIEACTSVEVRLRADERLQVSAARFAALFAPDEVLDGVRHFTTSGRFVSSCAHRCSRRRRHRYRLSDVDTRARMCLPILGSSDRVRRGGVSAAPDVLAGPC